MKLPTDVPASHWGFAAVSALYRAGIVSGCAPGLFCPDRPLTRDAMAVVLVRALRLAPYVPARPSFADVPRTHWAYGYIERLRALGITTGCPHHPGKYCPGDSIVRANATVFVQRAKRWATLNPARPTFADVPRSHWGYGAVEALAARCIVGGCATNPLRFCPDPGVTRVEGAALIARAFGLVAVPRCR